MKANYEVTLTYVATVVVVGAQDEENAIEQAKEELYCERPPLVETDACVIADRHLASARACADYVMEAAP